jgi:hypothetical protein
MNNTKLCDKAWQCLAAGLWFSPGIPVSSSNKTAFLFVKYDKKIVLSVY